MPYSDPQRNRECVKKYHTEHSSEIRKYKSQWYKKWFKTVKGTTEYRRQCKERSKRWRLNHPGFYREKNRRIRKQVIALYGNQCECCGEVHIEFLTLDHINGGGYKDRKKHGDCLYAHLIKRKTKRKDLRVLCMNCNWAIRFGEECPHAS